GWNHFGALLSEFERRIHPDAKYRPWRQIDVVAFGGRNRPASTYQNARERTFETAENTADDRSHSCSSGDLAGVCLPLKRLGHGGPNRVRTSVDREPIEEQRHLSLPIDATSRGRHGIDYASQDRSGGHERLS